MSLSADGIEYKASLRCKIASQAEGYPWEVIVIGTDIAKDILLLDGATAEGSSQNRAEASRPHSARFSVSCFRVG